MRVASGNRFEVRTVPPPVVDPATDASLPPAEVRLWILEPDENTAHRQVAAFNLSLYFQSAGIHGEETEKFLAEMKNVIADTLSRFRRGSGSAQDQLEFQFHPGASLLIVIGPWDALDVARTILTALPGVAVQMGGAGQQLDWVALRSAASQMPGSPAPAPGRPRPQEPPVLPDAFRQRYSLPPNQAEPASGPGAASDPSRKPTPSARPATPGQP